MTEAIWMLIITAIIAPIVQAVLSIWMQSRQGKVLSKIEHNTNSLTQELVKVNRSDASQEATTVERDRAAALAAAVAQAVELDRDRPEPPKKET